MSNPMLNDKVFEESRAGWAAPQPPSPGGQQWPAPAPGATSPPPPGAPVGIPASDGPVTPWTGAMTLRGTINKGFFLLGLLLVAVATGWAATAEERVGLVTSTGQPIVDPATGEQQTQAVAQFPAIAMLGVIIGFAAVISLYFRPQWAKYVGPVYALGFGFAVGAISKAYETFQNGIVLQAAGATVTVFAVMLFLYRTGIIQVTDKFRRIVVTATLGIMVFYGISLVANLFGSGVPFLRDATPLGIGVSLFICVIAAMNLALDFDFIERGTKEGLAKDFEWYAAFTTLVTIVWLYLEILRLLAKLQQR